MAQYSAAPLSRLQAAGEALCVLGPEGWNSVVTGRRLRVEITPRGGRVGPAQES